MVFSEALARRVDPRKVGEAYAGWPTLARKGYAVDPMIHGGFQKGCVMGMGGSASGGDILAGWMAGKGGPELSVWKGGPMTRTLKGALAVACSASGNTTETIAMAKTAVREGATVVSMSAGGELMRVSRELGVPHTLMPDVLAPRYMLPYMLFACLSIFDRGLHLNAAREAKDSLDAMAEEGSSIGPGVGTEENPSKRLALDLLGKTPAVFGTAVTRGVGMRFKNVVNENAKKHSYFAPVPDAFHNEIEAWEDPTPGVVPVFLRHSSDSEDDARRMDTMAEILASAGRTSIDVKGRGETSLAQLASMVYRLDMASYYLALASGVDPFPTRLMDRLKKG